HNKKEVVVAKATQDGGKVHAGQKDGGQGPRTKTRCERCFGIRHTHDECWAPDKILVEWRRNNLSRFGPLKRDTKKDVKDTTKSDSSSPKTVAGNNQQASPTQGKGTWANVVKGGVAPTGKQQTKQQTKSQAHFELGATVAEVECLAKGHALWAEFVMGIAEIRQEQEDVLQDIKRDFMKHPRVYVTVCPLGCGARLLQSEVAAHVACHHEKAACQLGNLALEKATEVASRLLLEHLGTLLVEERSSFEKKLRQEEAREWRKIRTVAEKEIIPTSGKEKKKPPAKPAGASGVLGDLTQMAQAARVESLGTDNPSIEVPQGAQDWSVDQKKQYLRDLGADTGKSLKQVNDPRDWQRTAVREDLDREAMGDALCAQLSELGVSEEHLYLIVGMLLELPREELIAIREDEQLLGAKVREAREIILSREPMGQHEGQVLGGDAPAQRSDEEVVDLYRQKKFPSLKWRKDPKKSHEGTMKTSTTRSDTLVAQVAATMSAKGGIVVGVGKPATKDPHSAGRGGVASLPDEHVSTGVVKRNATDGTVYEWGKRVGRKLCGELWRPRLSLTRSKIGGSRAFTRGRGVLQVHTGAAPLLWATKENKWGVPTPKKCALPWQYPRYAAENKCGTGWRGNRACKSQQPNRKVDLTSRVLVVGRGRGTLHTCGDVHPNPGPVEAPLCTECGFARTCKACIDRAPPAVE
ncbi:MAG: hypothetical protein FJY85_08015, partial [Deltaproteobacteria bacterium]|nr:hypothetical protein [Deltaproteobacteria bacterium]